MRKAGSKRETTKQKSLEEMNGILKLPEVYSGRLGTEAMAYSSLIYHCECVCV